MSKIDCDYSQVIGKPVFCGTLRPSLWDKNVLDICLFEGTVEDVICFDRFSPTRIKTEKGLYSCPMSSDEYFQMVNKHGRELGWFLVDLSKKNLLRRLRKIYKCMAIAEEAKDWFGLKRKSLSFDGMPDVIEM